MSESKPIIIALAIAGLGIVGYLAYAFMQDEPKSTVISKPIEIPAPEPVVTPAPVVVETIEEPVVEVVEEEEAAPEVVEKPAFILPRLDDSDGLIRDGVVTLTRHEGINQWVRPGELVRKFVVLVDNAANGNIAREAVTALGPEQPFVAKQLSEKAYLMDDVSYSRYNMVTDVFVSLDSRRAAEFYELLEPLFQEAYEELGYPDKKFNTALFASIGRLLETPVIDGPVRLIRPVVMYEYEDQRLESLGSAQKQMLRMGPRNTKLIQAKLSELAIELRSILAN